MRIALLEYLVEDFKGKVESTQKNNWYSDGTITNKILLFH